MALMRADTESEVIGVLKSAGYWDDPNVWRPMGDDPGNYSTIGNQQSEAVAALVEKIVNSIDARLTNACLEAGLDPASPEAPQSIREAVARFFESRTGPLGDRDGRVAYWEDEKATAEGRQITVTATGNMPEEGWPSISVADMGEGQCPDSFPDTFMSLHRTNKLKIQFVQGKFNMGGTGALQFCEGRHRLQLVVSRRNPELLGAESSERDGSWGFTVVRREVPVDGSDRSSVFTFLAPVQVNPSGPRQVLTFAASTWPIFPEADSSVRDAYYRPASHGSLVKLYEYHWRGTRTNIVRAGDGLLRRLDQALPELPLPVRIFECRNYSGHGGSFATNILGLASRLERDRRDKLEDDFPIGSAVDVHGHKVTVKVYAFKKGQAAEYRTSRNGVLFTINGQTHATKSTDLFRRQSVGMSYLADSLLAIIDCTNIDGELREDLFMNSRDRLRDNALSALLIEELEDFLSKHEALRALRNQRREQDISKTLEDSKPLADTLRSILRKSPALANFLLRGIKLSTPFSANGAGREGDRQGSGGAFVGRFTPSYFHFRGKRPGETLRREGNLGSRLRVQFETDVQDDYFVRDSSPGELHVWSRSGDVWVAFEGSRIDNPHNGVATLHLTLPADVEVGQELEFEVEVTDELQLQPIRNVLRILVAPPRTPSPGGDGRRPGASTSGVGTQGGGGVDLPEIRRVTREEWSSYDFYRFTEESALVVVGAGEQSDVGGHEVDAPSTGTPARPSAYDFYVNVDNKYLKTTLKESRTDVRLLEAKFVYSLVLVGLALLNEQPSPEAPDGTSDDEDDLESRVSSITSALAPILLPMIEGIGGLSLEDE